MSTVGKFVRGLKTAGKVIASRPPKLQLPIRKVVNSQSIKIDRFDAGRFAEAYAFFTDAAVKGIGYEPVEVTEDRIRWFILENPCYSLVVEDTGELVGVLPVYPSPVCRSNRPMSASMFAMVSEKYRRTGLGLEMLGFCSRVAVDLDYLSTSSRSALTAKTPLVGLQLGGKLTGIIPACSHIKGFGFMDNTIGVYDFRLWEIAPNFYKDLMDERDIPLPPLIEPEVVPNWLNVDAEKYGPTEISTEKGTVTVRAATGGDIWRAEALLRAAAERGEGFGMDEFTEDGYFNRKFFQKCSVFVMETEGGEVVGTALYGPSNMVRTDPSPVAHFYCAVKPSHRRLGLGTGALQYCIDLARRDRYKHFAVDVPANDTLTRGILFRLKFAATCSFPYSVFVKHAGPCDSILYCKELSDKNVLTAYSVH